MAAYSWPLSRQTALDLNGDLVAGARLQFFLAGTTTPLVAYSDSALTAPLPAYPDAIEADASGRWPRVFLPYQDYKEVVETPGGTLLWNDDGIANPAPAASGGGGSVPDSQLVKTGFVKWDFGSGALADFVRLNALTIGNAGSGATERANADTEALFIYLWNRLDNTMCPVSGGRGANGAADYAAGKTLQLPDMRGRGPLGVASMGGSASGRLNGGTFSYGLVDLVGSVGGVSTHTLSIAEMPSHDHAGATGGQSADHTHSVDDFTGVTVQSGTGAGINVPSGAKQTGGASNNHTHPISAQGGGGSHNNLAPFMLGTWYAKL